MIEIEIPVDSNFAVAVQLALFDEMQFRSHYDEVSYTEAFDNAVDRVTQDRFGRLPTKFTVWGERVTHLTIPFDDPREAFHFRLKHG